MSVTSTNLKRDTGNTKDCLCNWVQLLGINFLLVLCGCEKSDLRKDRPIFDRPVYGFLY